MLIEHRIANAFGYEYCVLFPNARSAIAQYVKEFNYKGQIPSNVCPELATAMGDCEIVPVDHTCGLAIGLPVQLYGYREEVIGQLEIDPLMTGYFSRPCCINCVISFGRNKTLDINGGGALLTNKSTIAALMTIGGYFPAELREHLDRELDDFYDNVHKRREQAALWDRLLADRLTRIPREQIIPWRVIRRVPHGKRDEIVRTLRDRGIPVGTNYPPLDGIQDKKARQWGDEVINFWTNTERDLILQACDLIEAVME